MKSKLLFILVLSFHTLFSQTIYVDQSATGANNGTDWANAYTNLQTAITNIGTNTTINVAQGTYYTTTTTDRTISFNIPRDKKIFGGFPTGGGTRDSELNPTILSGDIGTIGDNTDNSYHVVFFNGTSYSTEIDGFIIEKGYANGSGSNESNGGGILILTVDSGDSNAYIRYCTIRDNYAVGEGGGIFVYKRAEIYNCKIYSNQADSAGGGISISTSGRIYNSYIVNNKSVNFGGGIKITGINSAPKAINCVIANNECEYYGAGAYLSEGYLNNCTIVNNGGNGVHFGSYGSTFNGIIWGNSTYQSTHVASSNSHLVENNCIQDISSAGTNIGISSANNGAVYGENYPRFNNPTTFTGNATTPAQLNEILNADWSINPQSAAINFGDNSSYPTTSDTPTVDIIGSNRTINTTMDAGAHEALTNIVTTQASNQQPTSASLNGEVLFAETTNTVTRGFVYATTPNFDVTTATSVTNSGTGLGVYTDNITGLTENQMYYYKTWVQFDGVKYYGNEVQFNTSNLIAYYPFNGNANDESGSENNGTVNGAILTADRFGNSDSAYYFDGVNDYIECLFPGPLEATSRTISFWAKTNVTPTSDYGNVVLSYGIITTSFDYGARFDVVLNSKGYGLGCGLGGGEITKTFDNSDGDWHFYTVVFDNSIGPNLTDILFYADGNLLSTTSAYNNVNPNVHTSDEYPLHIGMLYGYGRYFEGSIDEIKISNKALTSAEVLNTANELIAYYPFNGNANDESGNANHGTVNGATLTTDRFGNADSAYSFNGNDIITVAHKDILNSSNELSISVWVKPNSQQNAMILGKSNYTSNTNYLLRTNLSGFINFEYKDFAYSNSLPLIVNDWNHIVVVSNTDNSKQVYINGVLATHTGGSSPYGLVTNDLTIGARDGAEFFNGSIDDLRIYKSALTNSQVSSLYTNNSLNVEQQQIQVEKEFYVFNNTLCFKNTQNLNELKNIEVYNLLGQKVFETSVIENQISFSTLQNGIYLLIVKNKESQYAVLKFIIM